MAFFRLFEELAGLAAIRGDLEAATRWDSASRLGAVQTLESADAIARLLETGSPAMDPALERELRNIAANPTAVLDAALEAIPGDLRRLLESKTVTVQQLAALHGALGVTSASDLLAELRRQTIRQIPGFTDEVETRLATALPTLRAAKTRIPLGRALRLVIPILEYLEARTGHPAFPVGSLRRGRDTVGDLEVIAPTTNPSTTFDELLRLPGIARVIYRSSTRLYFDVDREQVGVRCPAPEGAGALLLALTGSGAHLDQLSELAASRGWRLGPEGLAREGGGDLIASSEEAIYAALDLPFIPPEIREGQDEVPAARQNELPTLVNERDIRGDLHTHTSWSDGRDSVEAVIRAAVALGYEYVAITDHSQRASASRTLALVDIPRQAAEIAALRERYPEIAILHGCEVEIMADGRLDFADNVLRQFDIVLASLHERAGHSPDRLLARYLDAMRHPLVTIVTHPTNRQVPHRLGYDIDYDRLFEAAAVTGTVLEIDGGPGHLDLDGALARRAIAAGATVSIDSDSHRAAFLGTQMHLGVLTARRGWVEARHVLNTRPIRDVRRHIRQKRAQAPADD